VRVEVSSAGNVTKTRERGKKMNQEASALRIKFLELEKENLPWYAIGSRSVESASRGGGGSAQKEYREDGEIA